MFSYNEEAIWRINMIRKLSLPREGHLPSRVRSYVRALSRMWLPIDLILYAICAKVRMIGSVEAIARSARTGSLRLAASQTTQRG